jgi:DNA uptake protein ComE-like DNA-binding protein
MRSGDVIVSKSPKKQKPATQSASDSHIWFVWTLPQRRALAAFLVLLWVMLAIRYYLNTRFISDPQPQVPDRAAELADRINPNTAEWQDLAALPNLGEKRAKLIVAFREARRSSRNPVFSSADDLLAIRGIGVATVTKLKPYLIFQAAPATQP